MRIVALAFCLLAGVAIAAPALRSGIFEPPREAPHFTLPGSRGAPVRLEAFRGKVVALGFGYTSCPDVCPTTLGDLAKARRKLGAPADFQVIYLTTSDRYDAAADAVVVLPGPTAVDTLEGQPALVDA